MRRVTLLTAVVFFIVGVSVPLTALCQDESDTNGYAWERMSKNAEGQAMARLMVASYLRGYQAGCSMGYAMGIFELTQLLEGVEMPRSLRYVVRPGRQRRKSFAKSPDYWPLDFMQIGCSRKAPSTMCERCLLFSKHTRCVGGTVCKYY